MHHIILHIPSSPFPSFLPSLLPISSHLITSLEDAAPARGGTAKGDAFRRIDSQSNSKDARDARVAREARARGSAESKGGVPCAESICFERVHRCENGAALRRSPRCAAKACDCTSKADNHRARRGEVLKEMLAARFIRSFVQVCVCSRS